MSMKSGKAGYGAKGAGNPNKAAGPVFKGKPAAGPRTAAAPAPTFASSGKTPTR